MTRQFQLEPLVACCRVSKRSLLRLALYINDKGYYDIIRYNLDHEFEFPGLSTIIIGQLGPHITTEVDCESLFSMAGHLSHPNRNRTVAETFERLVIAKHRLSRIFCCKTKVLNEFMQRSKNKNWSEDDDRDDVEFWGQQKQEYLKKNPSHVGMFIGDDEEAELDVGTKNDHGTAI